MTNKTLDELIESVSKTHKFNKDKLIFLNTSDVLDGKILSYNYSNTSDLKGQAKKTIKYDDILFSEIRPKNKRFAYVNIKETEDFVVSTKLMVLRNKTKNVLTKYIYYFLTYEGTLDYLQMRAENRIGSFPQITFDILKPISVNIPDVEDQKKIVNIISALDDKIELNNRINAELEAMAKTLYDYWFVQFDFPVASTGSATEISRENVASATLSQQSDEKNTAAERSQRSVAERSSKSVAERSQEWVAERSRGYKSSGGKMVYNETLKREIPEGWGVKNLFEVCNVQYGFPFSTEYFNEIGNGIPVIRIRDIVENSVSNYSTEKNVDSKYEILKGDLLVGMDGNFHINYWTKNNCYLNQRVVKLTEKELPNIYLRYQIEPYIKAREASVSRTTVGHLSDKDLKAINVLVPPKEIKLKIKNIYSDVLNKIITNKEQNQELSALRDWLLPMLMNGQVKVG